MKWLHVEIRMCKSVSGCVVTCLEATKSWPIRTQMLRLGLAVLAIVLLLINCLVVFNLLVLRSRTLSEVRSTSDHLADMNIEQMASLMGQVVNVYVEACFMLLGVVQSAYLSSGSACASLQPLPSLSYTQLPESYMQYKPDVYGTYPVCLKQSSVKSLGPVNNSTLEQSSQLDYLFPSLTGLTIAGVSLTRLVMYFNTSNFIRIFPGTFVPKDYMPSQQPWFLDLQSNQYRTTISSVYNDFLGANSSIFSLTGALLDQESRGIGAISLDVPANSLYSSLQNVTLRGKGEAIFVGKNGVTLPNPKSEYWNVSRNLSPSELSMLAENPGMTFKFSQGGNLKASAARIPDSEDWNALLVLLMPEDVTDKYSDLEAKDIDKAGGWLIVITVLSSLMVLVSVALCICVYSNRLTSPLKSVVRLASGLHRAATSHHHVDLSELEDGDDSVQLLTAVFKELVRKITDNPDSAKGLRIKPSTHRFPVNELHQRAPWRDQLRQL